MVKFLPKPFLSFFLSFLFNKNFKSSELQQVERDCDIQIRDDENKKFSEILVIRHGETEWNADGRLQVSLFIF